MKTVQIRYFASVREGLGLDSEPHQTHAASVRQLRQELMVRGGAYADVLGPGRAVRVALNQVMANEDSPLPDGAEVAFFPPVTGG